MDGPRLPLDAEAVANLADDPTPETYLDAAVDLAQQAEDALIEHAGDLQRASVKAQIAQAWAAAGLLAATLEAKP
jgi:hypothetical protein